MNPDPQFQGPTPEFVLWSIRKDCDLKLDAELESPTDLHRQLRGVHELGNAVQENRVVEKWAYRIIEHGQQPVACSIVEVLQVFGGRQSVDTACLECPANQMSRWAGCIGQLRHDWGRGPCEIYGIQECIQRAVDSVLKSRTPTEFDRLQVQKTCPAWFGLWLHPEWQGLRLELLVELLDELESSCGRTTDSRRMLEAARACQKHEWALDVLPFPCGHGEGGDWHVGPHCGRCKAPQKQGVRNCHVCRRNGGPVGYRKRKARGLRPYVPLTQLYSATETDRIAGLIRAHDSRKNRQAGGGRNTDH